MNDELSRELTILEYTILGLLSICPLTGYSVIGALEKGSYRLSTSTGSIYPALKRLERHNIIAGELEAVYETRPRKVVEAGLAALPAESVYAKVIRDVLKWSAENPDWKKTWQLIEDRWDRVDAFLAVKSRHASFARRDGLAGAQFDADAGAAALAQLGVEENDVVGIAGRRLDFAAEQQSVLV